MRSGLKKRIYLKEDPHIRYKTDDVRKTNKIVRILAFLVERPDRHSSDKKSTIPMISSIIALIFLSTTPGPSVVGLNSIGAIAPADTIKVSEWLVPWSHTRPRDPFVAPDGRIWFCGQAGGYLGVLDPETGAFNRYDLGSGAGPHNLIVDADGFVWYAGNRRAHIGRLDPESGDIEKFPMPDGVNDPHTLVFDGLGGIWFTVQFSNYVGHLNIESGEVRVVEMPVTRSRPYGIKMDSKGNPWVVLFGTNKLATVNPETMELTTFDLEREDARPRRLVITSDDKIWYSDYAQGYLGRFDPETLAFREWPLPEGKRARPYGMAVDSEDRIWIVEGGISPNQFIGFDSRSGEFIESTSIPSGGGTVRHMYFHEPENTIWFGTDTNYIGKAILPVRKPKL